MLRLQATRMQRLSIARVLLIGATSLGAMTLLVPRLANAHFILVTPDAWMSQDSFGSPQKLGPCGNEGGGTATGRVTVFRPGQTIPITINEVIHHPGHYRVALAVNDRSELPAEPVVTPAGGDPCGSAAIQSPAMFPILADNMLPHIGVFSEPQTFMVTLPSDVTCSKCTLQVLEFMSNHGAPCFYHHCADIAIQGEAVVCGDAQVQGDEQCDDGNSADGDGCDSTCRLECGTIDHPKLTFAKLQMPPGDDTLTFRGALVLPTPVNPRLDPLSNGIRLIIADAAGTLLDVALPGGSDWTANGLGSKWAYRNRTATPPGGISKVVIRDKSASTSGLVEYTIGGKAGSFAISATNLPVTARIIVSGSGRQCGDTVFARCLFNASANKLKCD